MWKTCFHWVAIEGGWKLQLLYQIFSFGLMYLCRSQVCIHVDLSYTFKRAYDKVIFSWNTYWDCVKGILWDKFLVKLMYFSINQGFILLYPPKVNFSISMSKNHVFIEYMLIFILGFENWSCYCGHFKFS